MKLKDKNGTILIVSELTGKTLLRSGNYIEYNEDKTVKAVEDAEENTDVKVTKTKKGKK